MVASTLSFLAGGVRLIWPSSLLVTVVESSFRSLVLRLPYLFLGLEATLFFFILVERYDLVEYRLVTSPI